MTKTAVKNKEITETNPYRQTARLRFLHMAPRKVRRVADTIVGLSVNEAEAQLLFNPGRPARPLLKLVRAAVANAKNAKANPDKLLIESLQVDQGPMLKRFLPRAHGRATPIQKKSSHIKIVLVQDESLSTPRFIIAPPVKKGDKKKKHTDKIKHHKDKDKASIHPKAEKSGGFLKKIFRRKSV